MLVGTCLAIIRAFPTPAENFFGDSLKEVTTYNFCANAFTFVRVQVWFFLLASI